MAGAKNSNFKEIISPFLKAKMAEAEEKYGTNSQEYYALAHQYIKNPLEDYIRPEERRRHYESEMNIMYGNKPLIGVERLYRRTILVEPTTVCAAHCRWCLRGQYPVQTMTKDDIERSARYMASDDVKEDLNEVLITGGDPLMSLPLLTYTIEKIAEHSPNIKIIRIGSRVPFHAPERINDAMLEMIASHSDRFRFELGVNVNHPIEFWPESTKALSDLQKIGVRIYNQNPLLKGVNDDFDTLVTFYELLREHNIEAHYLFHAIPMRGMSHHRTSLQRGLDLATELSSCGEFSGRAKPRYAVLSDIGKIVIYHDTIVDRRKEDNALLLKSGFNIHDRKRWNPSWRKPEDTVVDEDGTMYTWYMDGTDETIEELEALMSQSV